MVERLNRMYDFFVDGATAADPEVKVGGPGIAGNPQYLIHFLEHVTAGRNAVSGQRGTRIDFVSWHGYGRTTQLLDKNRRILEGLRRLFPSLAEVELQQNEWGQPLRLPDGRPSPQESNYHEFEAAYLSRYVDAMVSRPDASVDLFLKWGRLTATGDGGWRTLTRYVGDHLVATPVFHVYDLLGRLGPALLEVVQPEWPASVRAIAARTPHGGVQVLLYHFDEENQDGIGPPVTVRVTIAGAAARQAPARLYRIDRHHSNFYRDWQRAGRPRQTDDRVVDRVRRAAELHVEGLASLDGKTDDPLVYSVPLPVNGVALLTVGGEHRREIHDCPHIVRVLRAEEELNDARQAARERPSRASARRLLEIADSYPDLFIGQIALRDAIAVLEAIGRPGAADRVRARLLQTTLGDDERLRLLEARLEFAGRRHDRAAARRLRTEIAELQSRLQRRGPWSP